MFRTCANEPVPDGWRGFETKARTFNPLGFPLVLLVLGELLHEIKTKPAAKRTLIRTKVRFKPGTPKSMKDKDLDAENGIITDLKFPNLQPLGPPHGFRMQETGSILYSHPAWLPTYLRGSRPPRCCVMAPWGRCCTPKAFSSTAATTS